MLPTDTHEAFVIEAANAGCHVLCEKPVTLEMESLERMLSACEKNGVRFMAAQAARWWPEPPSRSSWIRASSGRSA